MADINAVLVSRTCIALFIAANALVLLGDSYPAATLPLLVGTLCVLAPLPLASASFARDFRLNEALEGAMRSVSNVAGLVLMVAFGLGAAALGLVPAAGEAAATGELALLRILHLDAEGACVWACLFSLHESEQLLRLYLLLSTASCQNPCLLRGVWSTTHLHAAHA